MTAKKPSHSPSDDLRDGSAKELCDDPARIFLNLCGGAHPVGMEEFAKQRHLADDDLARVARADLRYRWSCGEAVRAEWYFDRFPRLKHNADDVLGLIYVEYLQRERCGEPPNLDELAARFPDLQEHLRLQIQFHWALDGEDDAEPDEVPSKSRDLRHDDSTLAARVADTILTAVRNEHVDGGALPRIRGYDVIQEIGRGGMGVVYKARDQRLGRLVALKMLLTGEFAGRAQTQRMRSEAGILARLNHPDLAQIYEVGEHDGRPFLAIEYVAGESLASHCVGEPQPAVWSATLVERIARALVSAHREGIIHRDLKPANILLVTSAPGPDAPDTPFEGELKIIDFGLAKLIENETNQTSHATPQSLTRTGDVLGTPGYMAPEQIRCQLVGPTADVHALGVVLYTLLTGTEPFRGTTPLDIVQRVLSQPPIAPSQLVSQIPVDLETICLKCLEKSPSRRYASALDLADDLRRFIEHRPIAARRARWPEHAWRWAQRNPAVASLLGTVVGLLTFGLIAVTLLYVQTQRESARANANFQFARQAVDTFLTRVGDSPELKAQGLEPLRRDLLATARDFYLELAEQHAGESQLADDLAQAHRQLGVVSRELGDYESARQQYQRAWEIYQVLEDRFPLEPDYAEWSIVVATQLSTLLEELGRLDEAESRLLWSKQKNSLLVAAHPDNPAYHQQLLAVLLDLTRIYGALDRPDDNRAHFDAACSLYQTPESWVHAESGLIQVAMLHNKMGGEFLRRGMLLEAEASFRDVCLFTQQAADDPHAEPQRSKFEAMGWSNLANVLQQLGRASDARESMQRARAILTRVSQTHPLVVDFQLGLANAWLNLGGLEFALREFAAAEVAWSEARQRFTRLADENPNVVDFRDSAALSLSNLGNAAFMAGAYDRAEQRYVETIAELNTLRKEHVENVPVYEHLLGVQANLAAVFMQTQRYGEAMEAGEQLLELAQTVATQQFHVPDYRRRYINIMLNLASACRQAGQLLRAEEVANDCVVESRALVERYPDQVEYQDQLAVAHYELGNVQFDADKLDQADRSYAESQEVRESMIRNFGGELAAAVQLAHIYFSRGRLATDRADPATALEHLTNAAAHFREHFEGQADPESDVALPIRKGLCEAYCEKARALSQLGRVDEALGATAAGLSLDTGTHADGLRALRARILAKAGQFDAARELVEQITVVDTLTERGLLDLATACTWIARETPDDATAFLDKARSLRDLATQRSSTSLDQD